MSKLLTIGLFAIGLAFEAGAIEAVGPHHRILRFEKNENPQNVLIGYTKLEPTCRFERRSGLPLVDFYWLLDGSRFKDPHPLLKKNIRNRLSFDPGESVRTGEADGFVVRVLETKEMKTSMKSASIRVSSSKSSGGCEIEAIASFERPGGDRERIKLTTIRTETKKTWLPPFRKIVSITLEGERVSDGRLVTQIFD